MARPTSVHGDGPDVLLINGWRCPPRSWGGLDHAVAAAGFRTTCLDPPSAVLAGGPRSVAAWLETMLEDRAAPYAIVGYSLGAQAALMLARALDPPPARLVLLAPLVIPATGPSWLPRRARVMADVGAIARMLLRAGRSTLRRRPRGGPVARPPSIPRFLSTITVNIATGPVRASVRGLAAAMALDLRPEADGVRVPTLVLVGEHDWMGPPTGAALLADALGEAARLVVVADAGHFMHLEDPLTTVPSILHHLSDA